MAVDMSAIANLTQFKKIHEESVINFEKYWSEAATQVEWRQKWTKVKGEGNTWFENGKLNVTETVLDKNIESGNGDKAAIISSDEEGKEKKMTYAELLSEVNRVGNYMLSQGIKKGDRVAICMPMICEQVVAMLATARIGAIHSVIFAGFGVNAVEMRLEDLEAKMIITSDYTIRRGKKINILEIIAAANQKLRIPTLVYERGAQKWSDDVKAEDDELEAQEMDAEDPLFILYTSGTTGKPKGIVHTCGGYLVYAIHTTNTVFYLTNNETYWCTADMGWITGHTYVVYGPLACGARVLIVEGAPDFPTSDRWWQLIDKYQVNVFYTSPTAARLLMKYDAKELIKFKFESLKMIGSVGEPLNPTVWEWLNQNIGRARIPIIDTWWQTETGGHLIVTVPPMVQKPGKSGLPFWGIDAEVISEDGKVTENDEQGLLVIKNSWPAVMRTYWKDHARYLKAWTNEGYYLTGDLAKRDADGYFQIIGRADDVLNISGHRVGSAEIENVIVSHPKVAESAVIGIPDELRGEAARVYVTLKVGYTGDESLSQELVNKVKNDIGHHAVIEKVIYVDKLPKTRSGKIMRRLLRAEALGKDIGDTSTLEG